MKNYYVVANKDTYKIFKKELEARSFKNSLKDSVLKGFYSKNKAESWAKNRLGKSKGIFFVVVNGRVPGIYDNVEDMKAQVTGFENAIVARAKTIEEANIMLNNREEIIQGKMMAEESKKMTPEKKLERRKDYLKSLKLEFNGDKLCFIDCEANDEKVISLGAVIIDKQSKEKIASFYSTAKPENFKKLDKYIQRLTGLTNEEIENSKDYDEVIENFIIFLKENKVSDMFSWSKSDKHFLKNSGKKYRDVIDSIVDIQPYISAVTSDTICKKNWGLRDMLHMYGIKKEIEHNALSDANDLSAVFLKWFNHETFDLNNIKEDM